MNITHNNDLHNGAINQTLQYDPTSSLFIPNWCYKKILKPNGFADEYAIHILAELMNLRRCYGTDGVDFKLHDSFTHFWEKFLFTTPRVHRATSCLKRLGLVTKSFYSSRRVITGSGKDAPKAKFAKELTLKLNHKKLLTLVEDDEGCL